jgi:hypothetical protein
MTTAIKTELDHLVLEPELADLVETNAADVDAGNQEAHYILPLLGQRQLFDKGTAANADGELVTAARLIRDLSRLDLSVGFTAWAHRMVIEYLAAAGTDYAEQLRAELASGVRPGVTGMAAAFKEFAGCGEIELEAAPVAGGYRVSGKLNWASNLYDDAVVVTAARTNTGEQLLFVIEAGAEGLTFGKPFGLLGLNATASAWVSFDNVFVSTDQVLTTDFSSFIAQVRPTFVVLQVAECLGVAEAALAAAAPRTTGVNETFAQDVADLTAQVRELVIKQEAIISQIGQQPINPVELLELRLDAASVAVAAAGVEVRVAGGAGYARRSPASRRFREAAFIPVQSPSESQLRWELAQARSTVAG